MTVQIRNLKARRSSMRMLWLSIVLFSCGVFAASYESLDDVDMQAAVPASLLSGPNYTLDEVVSSDGFQNDYLIKTTYGDFTAEGSIDLRVRIQEVDALAYLEAMSKSAVFLNALKDAGIDSVVAISKAFMDPVKTVKNIPTGLMKMFTGYVDGAKRGVAVTQRMLDGTSDEVFDPVEFKKRNYLVGKSEREWAAELSVDPYSTNLKLRSVVSDMSVIQFVGGLPVGFVIPPVGSLAVGVLEEVSDKVYSQSAQELEVVNRQCLTEVGIQDVDAFFEANYLTPTMHTMFCSAARLLADVEGLDIFSDQLSASLSFEQSRFVLRTLSLMAWHHKSVGEVSSFVSDDGLPYARTESGELLIVMPVDHLLWTEAVASRVDHLTKYGDENGVSKKSLWMLGQVSDRTREELASRDWQVKDRVTDERIERVFQLGLAALRPEES
jgi:hypothetical protein